MSVWCAIIHPAPPAEVVEDLAGLFPDSHWASPGVLLVSSEDELSPVYHRIKWQLEDEASLLVVDVAQAKCRYQEPGTTSWLRARVGGAGAP